MKRVRGKALDAIMDTYIGKKFGNTTVVGWYMRGEGLKQRRMFKLLCDCGNKHEGSKEHFFQGVVSRCNSCRAVNMMLRDKNKY